MAILETCGIAESYSTSRGHDTYITMPLNFSAAHSSRITKRTAQRNPLLKRSSSSPFSNFNQRKSIKRSASKPDAINRDDDDDDNDDDFFADPLEDTGTVRSLTIDQSLRDVAQIIQYVRSHIFDPLPEAGGFNSVRIAEILNFRKNLPPTVTVAHVHALTKSPTTTEKEIAELVRAGVVRKIVIPGRGSGGSSLGDGVVLFKDIESLARAMTGLDVDLVGRLIPDDTLT